MITKILKLVKVSYKHKKKFFKSQLNKNDIIILKILINYNIVKFFKKKNSSYLIFLNYYFNNPIFKIKNLYKSSNIKFINNKELIKYTTKKNHIYIISTHKGVINNIEANKNKIGGVLLFSISLQLTN